MSRAYCLTCNEPVHETPSGTCPLGHPVTTHDHGPEPWVGFAGDEDRATSPAHVPLERLDVDGRPAVPAGHAANGSRNGHGNGHGTALGGGHGHEDPFPAAFGHRSAFAAPDEPSTPPTERAPATGAAADDLAALLADALNGAADAPAPADAVPAEEHHGDGGSDDVPGTAPADAPEASWYDEPRDTDWDDLSSLAAELQLDASPRDDGPMATSPADLADEAVDAADIDDLLAELTGGLAGEHDALPDPPAPAAPADPAPTSPPPPIWEPPASTAPPPPPPAAAEPTLPPPPPGIPDAGDDVADAGDDVASVPPAPEPVDLWADPTPDPADPVATEPPVDLTNFTARGARVGDAAPGRPKKKRGWKR